MLDLGEYLLVFHPWYRSALDIDRGTLFQHNRTKAPDRQFDVFSRFKSTNTQKISGIFRNAKFVPNSGHLVDIKTRIKFL